MWDQAKKFKHINAVDELDEDEFLECLVYVNEYYVKHATQRDKDGVEELKGPESYEHKENSQRMRYCGSTLHRYPYYSQSVCLAYLQAYAGRVIGIEEATERQLMDALQSTSDRMKNCHVIRGTAVYMGPQCISHNKDESRVTFTPHRQSGSGQHMGVGTDRVLDMLQCSRCGKWRRVDLATVTQFSNEAWCKDQLHADEQTLLRDCPWIEEKFQAWLPQQGAVVQLDSFNALC